MRKASAFLLCTILILNGCTKSPSEKKTQNIHGYDVNIELFSESNTVSNSKLKQEAFNLIRTGMDKLIGDNGELTRLNSTRELTEASEACLNLLESASRMRAVSGETWNPFTSELNELWALDSDSPMQPDSGSLQAATARINASKLDISSDDDVKIIGEGNLALDMMALGHTIDEAAGFLIDAGATSGKIEAGGITRYWGVTQFTENWITRVSKPVDDDGTFIILPDVDGAIVNIDLIRDGFTLRDTLYHRNLSPVTGLPLTEPFSITIWADNSVIAVGFAEAGVVMGDVKARHWMDDLEEVAYFFISHYKGSYAGKADGKMSRWISSVSE